MRAAILLLVVLVGLYEAEALSCPPCGKYPCQDPVCCESGFYTKDVCGCCTTCAKPEGEVCGGPWGSSSGTCARGSRCLRNCACQTVNYNECKFPFTYKGTTYTKCTTDSSVNGKPWCAIEVDRDGVVIDKQWEDCQEECESFYLEPQCDENYLFNAEGRCVNSRSANNLVRTLTDSAVPAQLDDDYSDSQTAAPRCRDVTPRLVPFTSEPIDSVVVNSRDYCSCDLGSVARDLAGNLKGGCIPQNSGGTFNDYGDYGASSGSNGYCFLNNILDPANATLNCYEDAAWSASDGRFYSFEACDAKAEEGPIAGPYAAASDAADE